VVSNSKFLPFQVRGVVLQATTNSTAWKVPLFKARPLTDRRPPHEHEEHHQQHQNHTDPYNLTMANLSFLLSLIVVALVAINTQAFAPQQAIGK
jgi:hypothetical protein